MLAQLFEQRLGFTHGSWEQRLLRVQLNSMPPGSEILPHSDTGSYARNAHRIHIPLIVPQCVQFEQRLPAFAGGDGSWSEVPFKEGEAFEVKPKTKIRSSVIELSVWVWCGWKQKSNPPIPVPVNVL
jgi:hypothetical protein